MGLETSTFLSGLTPSWPLPGDQKSVGDDHIRLIKSALQSTFPNANKAMYFPTTTYIATHTTLGAASQNAFVTVDTSGGFVGIGLPTLDATNVGWTCKILKITTDASPIFVTPPSGTIITRVGSVASVRVGVVMEPAEFHWTGANWLCFKWGATIGSTENYDGVGLPPGYLLADGAAFSSTLFAELFLVLGASTVYDKRGRAEIGFDYTNVNMSTAAFGAAPILGATKVGGLMTLGTTNLPPYTPAGGVSSALSGVSAAVPVANLVSVAGATDPNRVSHKNNSNTDNGTLSAPVSGGVDSSFSGTPQGGASTAFSLLQPSICVNKIIRAC